MSTDKELEPWYRESDLHVAEGRDCNDKVIRRVYVLLEKVEDAITKTRDACAKECESQAEAYEHDRDVWAAERRPNTAKIYDEKAVALRQIAAAIRGEQK